MVCSACCPVHTSDVDRPTLSFGSSATLSDETHVQREMDVMYSIVQCTFDASCII